MKFENTQDLALHVRSVLAVNKGLFEGKDDAVVFLASFTDKDDNEEVRGIRYSYQDAREGEDLTDAKFYRSAVFQCMQNIVCLLSEIHEKSRVPALLDIFIRATDSVKSEGNHG